MHFACVLGVMPTAQLTAAVENALEVHGQGKFN